jgi:hypothetical protein
MVDLGDAVGQGRVAIEAQPARKLRNRVVEVQRSRLLRQNCAQTVGHHSDRKI